MPAAPRPYTLRAHRLTLVGSGTAVLGSWALYAVLAPALEDPLWLHALLAGLAYAVIGLSYVSCRFQRYVRPLVYGFFHVVIVGATWLCWRNAFAVPTALNSLLVLAALGLGGGITSRRPLALSLAITSGTLLPLLALVAIPEAEISRLLFGAALTSVGLLVLVIARVRISGRAQLESERTRYRAVVQQSNDGIYLLDPESLRFLDANLAYCTLIGYDLDALKTMSVFDVALEQVDTLLSAAADVNATGEFVSGERRHRRADGSIVDVYVSASLIHYGTRNAICVVARDVSGQRRYERELLRAKEQAEEMLRLKTAFLSNMSHELRTPLTAILGFAEILAEEVTGEQREYVEVIEQGAQRLYGTLNSVLDLAQLEGGTIRLAPEPMELSTETQGVVDLLHALAVQKGLMLRFLPSSIPITVQADASALRRVLTNLIGNAVKFTERGTVTVRLGIGGKHGDHAEAFVSIQDTGIGIDGAFLPHLFQEFKQASWGIKRSHEGNGLGLAITQRLVHLMAGRITVESEPGNGSTFTVFLPSVAALRQSEGACAPEEPTDAPLALAGIQG